MTFQEVHQQNHCVLSRLLLWHLLSATRARSCVVPNVWRYETSVKAQASWWVRHIVGRTTRDCVFTGKNGEEKKKKNTVSFLETVTTYVFFCKIPVSQVVRLQSIALHHIEINIRPVFCTDGTLSETVIYMSKWAWFPVSLWNQESEEASGVFRGL